MGNDQTGFTNTTYSALTDEKRYQYDQDQFAATPEASGDVEFHATLKIDDSADTVYAQLWNATNSTQVAEITHTGDTNWTLIRATNIDADTDWDTTNDDEYIVRIKCSGTSCSGNISNAKIVLDQNAAGGLTDVEVVHQQLNTLKTDADTGYTEQDFDSLFDTDTLIDPGTFAGGTINYFYESTLKTSNGSNAAFAELYNDSDNTSISNSEVSTTSTSYSRQRSSDITSDLPLEITHNRPKTFDTRLKNNSTDTTSASNSWIVIQVSSLATSAITAYADLYNLTDGTQVTSSEVSTTNTTLTRVRSSSITLTTAKDYVVRIKSGVSNAPIYIANAKILLEQTAAGGITDVEIVHQQVSTLETDADSTYTDQDYFTRFNPDFETTQIAFSGSGLTYFYEATLKTSNGSNAAYAQLKNDTDGAAITGSEVNTTATSYTRVRSGDITSNMPSLPQIAAKQLDTQLKNNSTDTTSASSSWLIIQVSSLATAEITAYADLYNLTDGTQVTSSEVSTTNTTLTRVRSSSITLTTAKDYVVRIRSGVNNASVHMANAKLILEQTGTVTAVELVQMQINTLKTDSDTGYTEQDFDNQFDPDNFAGGTFTYYFEATLKTSAGTGYADLYNDSDNASITSSEVTTTSTSYTRVRSSDITSNMPSAAKTMDTRLKNSASNTTSASSSWLIIQASSITNVNTVSAALYQDGATCTTQVSGSEFTLTSTTWTRVRTASTITLTDATDYMVCIKTADSSATASIANAKIIQEQSDVGGITDVELYYSYINTLATDTDSTYTDQDFLNQFDPDNFAAGTFTYYFESTIKTSNAASTAYAQLWNDTDSSAITGSEVTTTSTSYARSRSGDITANMPSAVKNMDNQLKNQATDTTSAASSWLIIQVSSLQIPENLLFALPFVVFMPYVLKWWRRRRLALSGLLTGRS